MTKDNKIKLLSIDGVSPCLENIKNGTYPLVSEFYAVTAGSENPDTYRLIEWILSPQSQEIIEKTGYAALEQ